METISCTNPDCAERDVPKTLHPGLLQPGESVDCGACHRSIYTAPDAS